MRRLTILRHAKSDWPYGVPDEQRPLSARGLRDAPVAGEIVAEHAGHIDLVLVSPARRTQQTWALAAPSIDFGEKRDEPAIYDASVATLLELVTLLDDAVESAMLVGHNPGSQGLALALTRDTGPMSIKYPTAGVAVMSADVPWSEWAPGVASLSAFAVGRG